MGSHAHKVALLLPYLVVVHFEKDPPAEKHVLSTTGLLIQN